MKALYSICQYYILLLEHATKRLEYLCSKYPERVTRTPGQLIYSQLLYHLSYLRYTCAPWLFMFLRTHSKSRINSLACFKTVTITRHEEAEFLCYILASSGVEPPTFGLWVRHADHCATMLYSHIGNRTRVCPVKAGYPNQLDYMGLYSLAC